MVGLTLKERSTLSWRVPSRSAWTFIKDAIAVAVMNSAGKVVMESILETKAATIVQFIRGLHRNLLVTF